MDIILSNSSDEPIYQQIISQIKAQIMNGTLTAGDALPSMRVLAAQLQNTDFLREESVRQTEELLKKACEKAKLCNLSADDLKEIIDMLYGGEI